MAARVFPATMVSAHDGDTVRVSADLGMDIFRYVNARLVISEQLGINCIELGQPGGKEARDKTLALVPPGSPVTLIAYRWDKFGDRLDCAITMADGRNLAQVLVDTGYAASWNGTGPRPSPPWPIPAKAIS